MTELSEALGGGRYALVVLGCALASSEGCSTGSTGLGDGAAKRRVAATARAWADLSASSPVGPDVVVVSGGCVWDGRVEADAMADALVAMGVPELRIVRERLSLSTRENARYAAAQCAKRGIDRVAVVTCVWHLPRAAKCFEAEGLQVAARISAGEGNDGWSRRASIRVKERALAALVATR